MWKLQYFRQNLPVLCKGPPLKIKKIQNPWIFFASKLTDANFLLLWYSYMIVVIGMTSCQRKQKHSWRSDGPACVHAQ